MKKIIQNGCFKKAMALLMAVMMMASLSGLSTLAAGTTPDMTVTDSITVTGVTEGDKFSSYKLIDISYSAASNTLGYSWTADAATAVALLDTADQITVEEYMVLSDADRKSWLGKFISKYLAQSPTPATVETDVTATAAGAVFTNNANGYAAGGYLIRPTLTTSVYEPMLAVVTPDTDATGWSDPAASAIAAKKTELSIDKKAQKIEAAAAVDGPIDADQQDVVTFTVVVDVPVYDENTIDRTFTFTDSGTNLNYVANTLKIEALDVSDTVVETYSTTAAIDALLSSTATYPTADSALTIALPFNYDTLKNAGVSYAKLRITYAAKLAATATLGDAGNDNDADIEYSNYPYVVNSHTTKTDTVTVRSYKLELFKYDRDSTAATTYADIKADAGVSPLAGASFNLYRRVKTGETFTDGTAVGTTATIAGLDGSFVLVKTGLTTLADGTITADGVDITNGDYYLVETAAPSGYNLLATAVPVGAISGSMTQNGDTFEGVAVANSKGIILPVTGGIGTVIFTVLGIALMGAAVLVYVISKKRKTAPKK